MSPVGICFLVAGAIVNAEDIGSVFESLALYIGTCITGLIIHSFVVYPLLYFIFTRKNPLKFFSGMIEPAITAFGTSSRYVCTLIVVRITSSSFLYVFEEWLHDQLTEP